MKKSILVFSAIAALGIGATVTSCGNGGPTIEVFVQTADHGWTGAVQSYAREKVAELNKEGKYNVKLTASEDATQQATHIADVLARGKENVKGIVLLPIDATMESTITKIVDSEIPFTQFDRVVETPKINDAKNRVSNVLGDNYGIGVATAERFIAKGIQPGEKIFLMPGDNSSVPVSRTNGFKDTLKKKGGWTDEQLNEAIFTTDYTGWSRTKARELMTSHAAKLTEYQWFFTHDSELAMGMLEELNATALPENVKTHFKTNVKAIASSSGLDEMYAVLENKHKTDYLPLIGSADLFDVTYDPAMIKIAIQDVVDHLDGKTVKKEHVVTVEVVDKDNVTKYQGFGTGNYRK